MVISSRKNKATENAALRALSRRRIRDLSEADLFAARMASLRMAGAAHRAVRAAAAAGGLAFLFILSDLYDDPDHNEREHQHDQDRP